MGSDPSIARRAINPVARFLFADLTRRLDPILGDTALEVGTREGFLGVRVRDARSPDRQRVTAHYQ